MKNVSYSQKKHKQQLNDITIQLPDQQYRCHYHMIKKKYYQQIFNVLQNYFKQQNQIYFMKTLKYFYRQQQNLAEKFINQFMNINNNKCVIKLFNCKQIINLKEQNLLSEKGKYVYLLKGKVSQHSSQKQIENVQQNNCDQTKIYHQMNPQIILLKSGEQINSCQFLYCLSKKVIIISFISEQLKTLVQSIKLYLNKSIAELLKNNILLSTIRNVKLQLIAKNTTTITINKNQKIFDSINMNQFIYYIFDGKLEKSTQLLSENKNKMPSINMNSFNNEDESLHLSKSNKKMSLSPGKFSQIIKKKSQLKSYIQQCSFIGDQFFFSGFNHKNSISFTVISQTATLLKIPSNIVKQHLPETSPDLTTRFYRQKQKFQNKRVESFREFDRKQRKNHGRQHLKTQLSPQIKDLRQIILKRYESDYPHKLNTLLPKQHSRILNKQKKQFKVKPFDINNAIIQIDTAKSIQKMIMKDVRSNHNPNPLKLFKNARFKNIFKSAKLQDKYQSFRSIIQE